MRTLLLAPAFNLPWILRPSYCDSSSPIETSPIGANGHADGHTRQATAQPASRARAKQSSFLSNRRGRR
jgi:hypothetical protein